MRVKVEEIYGRRFKILDSSLGGRIKGKRSRSEAETRIGFAFIHGIKRFISVAVLVLTAAADVYLPMNLWGGGTDATLLIPKEDYSSGVTQISAPDPSLDGPYKPQLLFYGSGWDHRQEYGKLVR